MRKTAAAWALVAAGCGGAGGQPAAAPDLTMQFDRAVPAGSEVHVCKEFVMPAGGAEIARFESKVPPGTHHLLAYRVPKKTAADVTGAVFDCGDVPGPIVFTQSADDRGSRWPDGVGVKVAPGEVVRLELHYLNLTTQPATASVELDAYFAAAPLAIEAGSLFMYDRDIAVPAHGTFTAKMHCAIPQDIRILDLLPHEHVHGSAERVYLSGGGLAQPQLLMSTKGYGDQETRHFDDAPIAVKAGQAIDYECDYRNQTDEDVVEGPSKEHNEMCMVLGDYYPRMPTPGEWCTVGDSGPIEGGDKTCAEALKALQDGKDVDFASEVVMTEVCAKSQSAWNAIGNCAFNSCSDVCPGPSCAACVTPRCLTEFGACQQATCN